jgi:VanZ family protein
MNGFTNACRRAGLMLLALYWTTLFVATHLPRIRIPGGASDKLAHFMAFAGLAFLMAWCLSSWRPSWRAILTILAVVVAYAALDETTQMLVPTRQTDVVDWMADVMGGLAGLLAYAATLALAKTVWGAGPQTPTVAPSNEAS